MKREKNTAILEHRIRGWLTVPVFLSFPFLLFSQPQLDTGLLQKTDARIEQYLQTGPLDSLIHYSLQKIKLLEKADDLASWVNAYLDLALINPEVTLSYLDTMSVQMWRSPRDSTEKDALLWCFMYQGYYLKETGDVLASAQAYEKALDLYSGFRPADFDIIEWVYKPLGNHYTRLGDNEKAIHLFTQAIEIAQENYPSGALAGLYNNLGLAYWNQARYTEAIEQYQKGLSLADLSLRNRALLLSNLAGSYFDQGDLEKALITALEAESLLFSIRQKADDDPQLLGWISGNKKMLGRIYLNDGNYKKADKAFREALQAGIKASRGGKNRQTGKIYIELGELRQAEGQLDEALASYNEALASVLPDFQPKTQTDNPDAAKLYEENTLFEALEAKGGVLLDKFNADQNIKWLEASLECHQLASRVERLLRQTYQYQSSKLRLQGYSRRRSEQAIEVAYRLYTHTQDVQYISRAFEFAEQNKATILLEAVKKNVARQKIGREDSLFTAEQQLLNLQANFTRRIIEATQDKSSSSDIEQLEERKREITAQLLAVREQIERKYPAFGELKKRIDPVSIEELQEYLRNAQSLVVEYFEGREALYVFLIGGEGPPQMEKIPLTENTKTTLFSLRRYFTSSKEIANEPEAFLLNAYEAYEILLGQLSPHSEMESDKLLIIPDGQINFIPFETLITERSDDINLANAPYLIKRQTVYYAFSATLWQTRQTRQPASSGSLLAMAPVFSEGERGFLPLEHSRAGARSLASKVKNGKLLLGKKASLGNFKKRAPEYRVLHLSTHAYSNDQGAPPAIAFIDSNLYLPELYALSIPAGLVVLSACETGLGEMEPGEGIMSLARGFSYAGAAGLVSSLWNVNDKTTSDLFLSFYDQLLEDKSIAQSLRAAKIAYLEDPSVSFAKKSPYYWAGFVFIGQDREVALESGKNISIWLIIGLALGGGIGGIVGFRVIKKSIFLN